jgi:hypothetical protein
MIDSDDSTVVLYGIQYAGEMCTDDSMKKFMYELDLVKKLIQIMQCKNVIHLTDTNWHALHAIVALSHLATSDTVRFKQYITETIVDEENNLLFLLEREITDKKRLTDKYVSSYMKFMIEYGNSILEKISTIDENVNL